MKQETTVKKGFNVPHTYVIIFFIILIAVALTYILPAGEYERMADPNTGRTVVNPDVFNYLEDAQPTTFFGIFKSIYSGMVDSAGIIFFVFIVGGSFQMITATNAIERGIGALAQRIRNVDVIMVPLFIVIFAIFGGTIGMAEEAIVFVPIGIALARALGYDALTGTSMIVLGAACGFTSGFMNPFTVGVAQGIAELPTFSGIGFRLVLLVVFCIATMVYIMRYAKKVKANPELSIVRELELKETGQGIDIDNLEPMSGRHVGVLIVFVLGFAVIIYGVFTYGWYVTEIASTFLAIGIISSIIGGLSANKMAAEFVEGAKMIAMGALVIGIARAIRVVMDDAMIIDTVIQGLAGAISGLPSALAAIVMYFVQIVINFFIPSGSGQAATTMPIMAPLADVIGMNRQVAVLAYQLGDGFTNSIIPTSGVLLASISMAKIKYDEWVKFAWPLISIWIVLGAIAMVVATAMNYGPF